MDSWLGPGRRTLRYDLARYWLNRELYWADLVWFNGRVRIEFRCWQSPHPIAVATVPPRWVQNVYRGEEDLKVMSFLRRRAEADQSERVAASAIGRQWAEQHPAVHEYMTATKYPDGGTRQTATLMLFQDAGEWKCCLRDRDTSRVLWVTAPSLPELLATLEATLEGGGGEWRREKVYPQKGGKKAS